MAHEDSPHENVSGGTKGQRICIDDRALDLRILKLL